MTRHEVQTKVQAAVDTLPGGWLVAIPISQPMVHKGMWAVGFHRGTNTHRTAYVPVQFLDDPVGLGALLTHQLREAA